LQNAFFYHGNRWSFDISLSVVRTQVRIIQIKSPDRGVTELPIRRLYLTEFLLFSGDADPGLKIHTIKVVATSVVGI